jgi:hypothetical protein
MLFPGSTTISRSAINHPALSHSQIKLSGIRQEYIAASSVASPTIQSRYANIAMFINYQHNQFLQKWIMIMSWNLHGGTKSLDWLRHWLCHNAAYDIHHNLSSLHVSGLV